MHHQGGGIVEPECNGPGCGGMVMWKAEVDADTFPCQASDHVGNDGARTRRLSDREHDRLATGTQAGVREIGLLVHDSNLPAPPPAEVNPT